MAINRFRALILRIKCSVLFRRVFYAQLLLLTVGGLWWTQHALMYLLLLACVMPQRVVPVVLALASIVINARLTYGSLLRAHNALNRRLKGLRDTAVTRSDEMESAVEAVLMRFGFDKVQIMLIIVVYSIAFAACVAFLFLSVSLFVGPEGYISTLVSSAIALSSAFRSLSSATGSEVSAAMLDNLKTEAAVQGELGELLEASNMARELGMGVEDAAGEEDVAVAVQRATSLGAPVRALSGEISRVLAADQ